MVYVFFLGFGAWHGFNDEGYQKIVSNHYTACGVFILSESDGTESRKICYKKHCRPPSKYLIIT